MGGDQLRERLQNSHSCCCPYGLRYYCDWVRLISLYADWRKRIVSATALRDLGFAWWQRAGSFCWRAFAEWIDYWQSLAFQIRKDSSYFGLLRVSENLPCFRWFWRGQEFTASAVRLNNWCHLDWYHRQDCLGPERPQLAYRTSS